MNEPFDYLSIMNIKSQQQQELDQLFQYMDQRDKSYQANSVLKKQQSTNERQQINFQENNSDEQNKTYESCYQEKYENYNYQVGDDLFNRCNQCLLDENFEYKSYSFAKNGLSRIKKVTGSSCSQQIKDKRSLNALISNKERVKYYQDDTISLGSDSSDTNKSKLKFNNKMQKEVQSDFFINPFTSESLETMNLKKYKKLNSLNSQQLLQKVDAVYKKMILYGQKFFFKSKQNEEKIDQILASTGLKTSKKLGKSKTFREIKAIYHYMQQTKVELLQINQRLKGIDLLEKTYINQFKQLMGYQKDGIGFESKLNEGKSNLLEFGFSASKSKKQSKQ